MSERKRSVAMILAGGQGSRLGVLTRVRAKPAVPYGGKYRIIDFPLSNCTNSGIDVVGILTQYEPFELNSYIGNGAPWELNTTNGGAFMLSPSTHVGDVGSWYAGTADAIFQNIRFIDRFDPEYLVVLSGDHIYKMDYSLMTRFHEDNGADATIAVMPVPIEEASRFGILATDETDRVTDFVEKPAVPPSNLASMGIYVFSWAKVRAYLIADAADEASSHDFGKNVIPAMLAGGERLFAYRFEGYWRDVGTIDSLWEANMDLLDEAGGLDLTDSRWTIYSRNPDLPAARIGAGAALDRCMIAEGCNVEGAVTHSVIFQGVRVRAGATVTDSLVMAGAIVGVGAQVHRAVIAEDAVIGEGCVVGEPGGAIAVIGQGAQLRAGCRVAAGQSVEPGAIVDGNEGA
ncbi:MAG: glucose-1-phosphate adenylyltransferase [Eggerthellaceae bacterium]|nr:glucose-1-phosphate adenylyltransferase [Eggerthellaceae bacterium]